LLTMFQEYLLKLTKINLKGGDDEYF